MAASGRTADDQGGPDDPFEEAILHAPVEATAANARIRLHFVVGIARVLAQFEFFTRDGYLDREDLDILNPDGSRHRGGEPDRPRQGRRQQTGGIQECSS